MMLVLALSLYIEVHTRCVAQALEEMSEHFRGHIADVLPMEVDIPHQPRTPAEVEGHGGQTVVHGQREAIALDAALAAQGLQQAVAQGQGRVLNGVMLVDVQVALSPDGEVDVAVAANLLEHVVEEPQTRVDVASARSVESQTDADVGFAGHSPHLCPALTGKQQLGYFLPGETVATEDECAATHVAGQLRVGFAIANDIAARQVVLLGVHVFLDHARAGLARRSVVLREMAVDEFLAEHDSLAPQCFDEEAMDRPERLLGKRRRAQSVLIGHHDEFEVRMLAHERQTAEHALDELQLGEIVNLFVGRFLDERTISIDEQYSLHVTV